MRSEKEKRWRTIGDNALRVRLIAAVLLRVSRQGFGTQSWRMRDHKSLKAWIEAHRVVNAVFDFCEASWRPQARAAFDQLQRSALSVQLNIAEGYARSHQKQFLYHLEVAYGSAVETTELIELLKLRGLLPDQPALAAIVSSRQCQQLLLGLIKRLRGTTRIDT